MWRYEYSSGAGPMSYFHGPISTDQLDSPSVGSMLLDRLKLLVEMEEYLYTFVQQ